MKRKDVIAKGRYRHPQQEGIVAVNRYIVLREDGRKCLLLQLYNQRNETLDRLSFRLLQYNAAGEKIGSETLAFSDVHGAANALFVLEEKIALEEACTDFKILLISAEYGRYVYSFSGGNVRVDYAMQSAEAPLSEEDVRKKTGGKPFAVKRRRFGFSALIALLSVLLIGCIFVLTYLQLDDFKRNETAFSVDQIEYTFIDGDKSESGRLSVTGYSGNAEEIVIPSSIEGYPVEEIAEEAFAGNTHIRSVTVESPVLIGERAFADCTALSSFDFSKILYIGSEAFSNCSSLARVSSSAILSVGYRAFEGCSSLSAVELSGTESGNVAIGGYAFADCFSLGSVRIGKGLTLTGANAIFSGCTALTSLELQRLNASAESVPTVAGLFGSSSGKNVFLTQLSVGSMQSVYASFCSGLEHLRTFSVASLSDPVIEDRAFSGCRALETVSFNVPIQQVGNYAFYNSGISAFDTSALTYIGESAFASCGNLSSFDLGLSGMVSVIPENAFFGCSSLTHIVIPAAVVSIGAGAFRDCSALGSVTFASGGALIAVGDDAFSACESLKEIALPDTVISLGGAVFSDCTSLVSAELPSALYTLPARTFSGCSALSDFVLPDTVREIGTYAFRGCSSLAALSLSPSVTTVRDYAFTGCTALTSFTLPESVAAVGRGAFSGCSSLAELAIPFVGGGAASNEYLSYLFGGTLQSGSAVPASLVSVTVLGGEQIASDAFYGCSYLQEIVLPAGVRSIGSRAFSGCSALTALVIPDQVQTIGRNAFTNCTSLESLTLPFIGDSRTSNNYLAYHFGGMYAEDTYAVPSSLRSVTLTNATVLAGSAFYNLTSLEEIVLPEGLQTIGGNAFYNCSSLTELTVPESVQSIGLGAFASCSGLETLTVPFVGQSRTQNSYLAYNFGSTYPNSYGSVPESLKTVTVTDITAVADNAFDGCNFLEKVGLPNKVTSIGRSAFSSCQSLEEFEIPAQVTSIGDYAFSGCYRLSSIRLPASLRSIGDYAFNSCNRLYEVFNESDLPIVKGNWTYGGVAQSALKVYQSGEEEIPKVTAGSYTFALADGTWYLFGYPQEAELTLPASFKYAEGQVTEYAIPQYLFSMDSRLVSVAISDAVTALGQSVFSNASALERVTFGASVRLTEIPDSAFAYCTSLTEIELPSATERIENYAFNGCNGLRSVTVNEALQEIGYGAFGGCYALREIFNYSTLPMEIGSDTYGGIARYALVIHTSPDEADRVEYITAGGIRFAHYGSNWVAIGCDETVSSLDFSALTYNGAAITSYSIAPYAFQANYNLRTVNFGDGLTEIGESAFENCGNLRTVRFGDGPGAIGAYAFAWCYNLESVALPSALETIGTNAFICCYALTSVTLPASLTSIGDYAFGDCRSLVEVCNLSRLSVVKGSGTHGGVAMYALTVHDSADALCPRVESDGFLFLCIDGEWTLARYLYGSSYYINFTLPESFVYQGERVSSYAIAENAFTFYGGTTYVIPDCVTAIAPDTLTPNQNQTYYVYYTGTQEAWEELTAGLDLRNVIVYFYTDCVHENGKYLWTYDDFGNIVTTVLSVNGVCSVCGEKIP